MIGIEKFNVPWHLKRCRRMLAGDIWMRLLLWREQPGSGLISLGWPRLGPSFWDCQPQLDAPWIQKNHIERGNLRGSSFPRRRGRPHDHHPTTNLDLLSTIHKPVLHARKAPRPVKDARR
jgi:hypothetical protein